MKRTITVKGAGSIRVKPDHIKISMELFNTNKTYDIAMSEAAKRIEKIEQAVSRLGFKKDDLKTVSFNVSAEYENVRDENGNYHRQFGGYNCRYRLNLSFGFDNKTLSDVIAAIAESSAEPELSIEFTVKDPQAVNDKLLADAARNARHKAEVLCAAANCELKALLNVDYNWGEINLVSRTNYSVNECIGAFATRAKAVPADITPEDITASDTVTFVWEIE